MMSTTCETRELLRDKKSLVTLPGQKRNKKKKKKKKKKGQQQEEAEDYGQFS